MGEILVLDSVAIVRFQLEFAATLNQHHLVHAHRDRLHAMTTSFLSYPGRV